MTKLHERLQRLERVRPSTKKQLVLWREMDGTYRHGNETWGSVEEVLAAHPGQYEPDSTMIFHWAGGAE